MALSVECASHLPVAPKNSEKAPIFLENLWTLKIKIKENYILRRFLSCISIQTSCFIHPPSKVLFIYI
jgi:hypothetical protein